MLFRLRPESSISGVVTDEGNEPVRDAQVMLFRRDVEEGTNQIQMQQQVPTDDRGPLSLRPFVSWDSFRGRLRPSLVCPTPENAGKGTNPLDVVYPVTYFAGATDESGATPIAVTPGEKIAADVSLCPDPRIALGSDRGRQARRRNAGVCVTKSLRGSSQTPPFKPLCLAMAELLLLGWRRARLRIHGVPETANKSLTCPPAQA